MKAGLGKLRSNREPDKTPNTGERVQIAKLKRGSEKTWQKVPQRKNGRKNEDGREKTEYR